MWGVGTLRKRGGYKRNTGDYKEEKVLLRWQTFSPNCLGIRISEADQPALVKGVGKKESQRKKTPWEIVDLKKKTKGGGKGPILGGR